MKRLLIISMLLLFVSMLCGMRVNAETIDYNTDNIVDALPEGARDILDSAEITPDNSGAMGLSLGGVLSGVFGLIKHRA